MSYKKVYRHITKTPHASLHLHVTLNYYYTTTRHAQLLLHYYTSPSTTTTLLHVTLNYYYTCTSPSATNTVLVLREYVLIQNIFYII